MQPLVGMRPTAGGLMPMKRPKRTGHTASSMYELLAGPAPEDATVIAIMLKCVLIDCMVSLAIANAMGPADVLQRRAMLLRGSNLGSHA